MMLALLAPGCIWVSKEQLCADEPGLEACGEGETGESPPDDSTAPDDSAARDEDGDGATADQDCDDGDPSRYPGAEEVCDGVDQDCDEEVDEGVTGTWYADADEDGYGDDTTARVESCAAEGEVDQGGDCDDGDSEIWETCGELRSGAVELEPVSCPDSGDTAASEEDGIYRIYGDDGVDDNAYIGQSVDGGEDWDGDGVLDVVIGVPGKDTWFVISGDPGGDVFLELSASSESGADCEEADRSESAILASGAALSAMYDGAGAQVTMLRRADGPVLAIGAPNYASNAGAVLLFKPGAEDDPKVLVGPGGTAAGYAMANAGDMDGDGDEDLFIGSYTSSGASAVWVRYGTDEGGTLSDSDSLTDELPPGSGYFGAHVNTAGDVDGNGTPDLLIGTDRSGAAYLVLADASGTAADVTYDTPLSYYRSVSTSWTGAYPGPAGDLNGDGYADFVISIPEFSPDGGAVLYGGAAYVILGRTEGEGEDAYYKYNTDCESNLEVCADLTIEGSTSYSFLGYEKGTMGTGDLTGDGISDLVLGAPAEIYAERTSDPGAVYVFAGDGLTYDGATISTDDATFSLVGDEGGVQTGYSRAIIPDLDKDGCDELLVGALAYSTTENTRKLAGRAWLVSGCTSP